MQREGTTALKPLTLLKDMSPMALKKDLASSVPTLSQKSPVSPEQAPAGQG